MWGLTVLSVLVFSAIWRLLHQRRLAHFDFQIQVMLPQEWNCRQQKAHCSAHGSVLFSHVNTLPTCFNEHKQWWKRPKVNHHQSWHQNREPGQTFTTQLKPTRPHSVLFHSTWDFISTLDRPNYILICWGELVPIENDRHRRSTYKCSVQVALKICQAFKEAVPWPHLNFGQNFPLNVKILCIVGKKTFSSKFISIWQSLSRRGHQPFENWEILLGYWFMRRVIRLK